MPERSPLGRLLPRRPAAWSVVVLVVACALGASAWWLAGPRPVRTAAGLELGRLPSGLSRDRLNLVIITLDTTRADRIGAYGARDVETPAVDALAREGVLFEQAVAVAPLTLPVHSTLFTGRFPPEHGVRDNGGFFLAADQVTLAEVLKARGYRTAGFVGAYVLDSKWGIDQGFDTYFDDFDLGKARVMSVGSIQRPGNEVVDKALPWLEQAGDGPFFAWVHLYDPHTPYAAPEPFASRYRARPYNGEVAFADHQAGRVVERLKALGLYDRTIVVVMGDHGESLGDHGEATHGFFIYSPVTHVPFVIRAPFSLTAARRVRDPVRSVDLMPTVLDLLGVEPPGPMSGTSLVPLMTGARREMGLDAYSESMYPLHHYGWSDIRALRAGRYKVIDAPRPELYDVDRDPGEQTNLFDERRGVADTMLAQLRRLEASFARTEAAPPTADVDPEARARLAALGYVGSFVASASDPRTDRADPKDKIGLFNKLGRALELANENDAEDAPPSAEMVAVLEEVLREDAEVIDAWFTLGTHYLRHGQPRKSLEYFQKSLALKPDYDLAVINMAKAYRALGDDEAALAGFERYLQIDPRDAYVYYQVGEVWLDRGDRIRAEEAFRKALELDPQVAGAKNALGVIALERGDAATAERLVREAIAAKPDVRLAHFNLALLAERRGDISGAEREYLEELKQHPESYKAAFNLSLLYEQAGDRDGQIEALKQSTVSNPRFAEGYFYLAKAYLDAGRDVDEAIRVARKGLQLEPASEYAALGHYVLADLLNRKGLAREAAVQVALGRAAEGKGRGGK
jgi:arylsulfatase A-like enzyme/tetratricopeptide (TPR) repeat protein